jgi:hypothetical protein
MACELAQIFKNQTQTQTTPRQNAKKPDHFLVKSQFTTHQ